MANEKILIVEDQRAVAGALKLRLRGLGYDVPAIARDGFEALEHAQALKPDLILMDVRLGDGMDGIETAQRLRATCDIPVIFISAHVDARLLERARGARPAGFINKPFTTKDLLTAIDLALHGAMFPGPDARDPLPTDAPVRERDGVITADADGRVGFVNPAAEHLAGQSRRQLVGRPLAELITELYGVSPTEAEEAVLRVMNSGQEEVLPRPGDGRFAALGPGPDLLTPLKDPRGQGYGLALRFASSRTVASAGGAGVDRALGKALDALPHGVVVVDAGLRVRHANRSARETLARHRGVECRNELLCVNDKTLDQRLRELVGLALTRAAAMEELASGVMLVRSPVENEHVEVMVAPVPQPAGSTQEALALVYLFDSASQRQVSFDVLTALYGFTNTEAKLVQLMTNGMPLDEAAEELQISVNTARTHLKHIFHKTGINRQTELIHRIESGPASLMVQFDAAPARR